MKKTHWAFLLALAMLVSFGCGQTEQEVDTAAADPAEEEMSAVEIAYEAASEAYDATEDPEEQLDISMAFLEKFPDSERTDNVLRGATEVLFDELDRPEEAFALIDQYLPQISDPGVKLEAQKILAVLHSKAGNLDELDALAQAMEQEHEFKYTDYLDLMETGTEAEAWELVVQQADASLALATPEAFQAQYDDISEENAQKWGRRREAFSAAHKGWAQENLGQNEAALATFAENAEKTTFSFLGVDDTPLHINWGKSLIRQGKPEEAMKVLEAEALFGPEEAEEAYLEAWMASHDNDEGLEEHLWALRQRNSAPLPQFALANYDGETIDTADFKGNVILVAAWFPT